MTIIHGIIHDIYCLTAHIHLLNRIAHALRRNLRDIDYFHWSSQSWRDYWLDAISICLARGRGQIGTEVARTDVFHRQATHSVSGSEGEAS